MTLSSGGAKIVELNDFLTLAGVFVGGVIAGLIGYFRPKKQAVRSSDPVLTGVGMAFGEHDQMERLVGQVKRIAESLDVLADRRTDELEDIHRELLARLDMQERRKEQEEPRRRPDPPPRRR